MAIHQVWIWTTGISLHPVVAGISYALALLNSITQEIYRLRQLGEIHGYYDGDSARAGIPDAGVVNLTNAIGRILGIRMLMAAFLAYDRTIAPIDRLLQWQWWPTMFVIIGMHGLVLDFYYYWYHRAMHEILPLWKYHRAHHMVKHPTTIVGAYASDEQELFDTAVIPFLAYITLRAIGLPVGFYEWYICFSYLVFSEIIGHSGVRIVSGASTTFFWLLRMVGAELQVEDHDLHHRYPRRHSVNMGKQTRLYDLIFGTAGERIEGRAENIDYSIPVSMPIFSRPSLS